MFEPFSHYLSYGATDQQTVRELVGSYDGLLVPGTVAAFQREGTGGFVLTLSALGSHAPGYVIDPRFPLFQQALKAPKKSHQALADVLRDSELISPKDPHPTDFSLSRIVQIASAWSEFNSGYRDRTLGKFDKYAKRLGQPVGPAQAQAPRHVLAPYFVAHGTSDPWWGVSAALFQETARIIPACVRVIAAASTTALADLINAVPDDRLVVWVSKLAELTAEPRILAEYGRALQRTAAADRATFALYGGFFAVLLRDAGLSGASHGVGYGEARDWIELPVSGPPPARYYYAPLHRYISQDLAYQLWLADPALATCSCRECGGAPPIALDYHALMKHSVWCRAAEIESWAGLGTANAANRLEAEGNNLYSRLINVGLPRILRDQAERAFEHFPRWIDALRLLS